MSNPEKRTAKEKSSLPIVLLFAVLAILGMYGGWKYWQTLEKNPATAVEQTQPQTMPAEPPAPEIPGTTSVLEEDGSDRQHPSDIKAKVPCKQASGELTRFFDYLDTRKYIANAGLKGGSQLHFSKLAEKLFANPPIVSNETSNLSSILSNTAHFYRILREDDVLLVKEIIDKESTLLEATMAAFYRWSEVAPKCENTPLQLRLPLSGLYEYAGFFLNTLGGQSYLFRREPRVRLLVKYYAVLIVDRANETSANRYGIDIRPSIASLLKEMETTAVLVGRADYEAKLILLRDKYLKRYGSKAPAVPVPR